MSELIIKQFILGPIQDNNYLIIDENTKEAVLIDCTQDCEDIHIALEKYDAKLKYILLTHGHFDHILGINDLKKKYPEAKVFLHKDDKELFESVKEFVYQFMNEQVDPQKADGFIDENDILKIGDSEIKIIHTPGHTQGGVCYLIGNKIFTGDTLFFESVGRTDLPGGNFQQLKESIEQKLFTLDEKLVVFPGHGQASTIGHEKLNNNFL